MVREKSIEQEAGLVVSGLESVFLSLSFSLIQTFLSFMLGYELGILRGFNFYSLLGILLAVAQFSSIRQDVFNLFCFRSPSHPPVPTPSPGVRKSLLSEDPYDSWKNRVRRQRDGGCRVGNLPHYFMS